MSVDTARELIKGAEAAQSRAPRVHRRGWLVRRALVGADLIGLVLAFVTAQLAFGHTRYSHLGATHEVLLFVGTLPVWVLVARLQGLYRHDEERTDHSTADDLIGVFYLVTIGSWMVVVSTELSGLATPSTLRVSFFWGLAIVLVTAARGVARTFCRHHSAFVQNTVIVGAGGVGQLVAKKLGQHPEYGLELVGFVDANPMAPRPDLNHLTVLGDPDELPLIIRERGIERVVIAFSNEAETDTVELIRTLKDFDVQIDIVPRFFDILGPGLDVHTIEGLPLLGVPPLRLSRSSKLLKRAMDIALSLLALFFLAPLVALIALLIKRDSPGPVFFRQERMGTDEKTFRIYKFRTMSVDAEGHKHEVAHLNQHLADDPRMFKIHDDPRVTRIGRVLRRTSLDELPQLLNVIKGEMSLVGPRPLILDEDQHVHDWARKRLDLKPGVTGLWQVLGRSEIPFEDMVKLDYMYVTDWSLMNDLKLVLRTIPAVFGGRQAY